MAFKKHLTPIGGAKRGKGVTTHRGKGSIQQNVPIGGRASMTGGDPVERNDNNYRKEPPRPPPSMTSEPSSGAVAVPGTGMTPSGGNMLSSDESDAPYQPFGTD